MGGEIVMNNRVLCSFIIVSVTAAGCRGSDGGSSTGGKSGQRGPSWPKGSTILAEDLELVDVVASGDHFIAADSAGVIWSVSPSGGSLARIGSVGAGVVQRMVVAGDHVMLLMYDEQDPRDPGRSDFTKPGRLVRVSTKDGSSAVLAQVHGKGSPVHLATDGQALYVARSAPTSAEWRLDVPYLIDVWEAPYAHPTSTLDAGSKVSGLAADGGREYWPNRRVFWPSMMAGVYVMELGADGRWGGAKILSKDTSTGQVVQGYDGLYGFHAVDQAADETSQGERQLTAREMGVDSIGTRRMLSPGTLERIDRGGERHSIGGEVVERPSDIVVGRTGVCFADNYRGFAKQLGVISLPDGRYQSVAYAPGARCVAIEPDFVYAFVVRGRGIARIPRVR